MEGMASVPRTELKVAGDDEAELVARARRGDREAAAELLQQHELAVWRVCRHLLPPGEDVEAAVQETLLRGLSRLASFTGRGNFGGWLGTIAVNYCRDRLRRRRLVPFRSLHGDGEEEGDLEAVLPAEESDPERVAMAREALARVRKEVARLPRRQQEVFALRFFAGLRLEEIAAALAVEVGSVKTHLHRAVQRVRERVEEAVP